MSTLRRRFLGGPADSSSDPSREPSPAKGEPATLVSNARLEKLKKEKFKHGRASKRRQGILFGLGGLVGVVLAGFLANRHEMINLEGLVDFNLESFIDVIPAGIVKDARDLTVRFVETSALAPDAPLSAIS